jgi:hypothetical protein
VKHEHRFVVRTLNEEAHEAGWATEDKKGRPYWWRVSTCDDDECRSQYTEGSYERFPDRPGIGEPPVAPSAPEPRDQQELPV